MYIICDQQQPQDHIKKTTGPLSETSTQKHASSDKVDWEFKMDFHPPAADCRLLTVDFG
jgi:hypothetical protein